MILVPLLTSTLFASAFLLFWCQPMVGKMMLPALGGAAGVWTTCVLFFQAMLLAGYVYAHALGRFLSTKGQIFVHAVVLLAPLAFLPIRFDGNPTDISHDNPIAWLLAQLLRTAGLPFFAVSATAPLMQNWFASTGHTSARDPYFLYSASNAGSLLALLSYPFLVEPRLGVVAQSRLWFAGYAGLTALLIGSAAVIFAHSSRRQVETISEAPAEITWKTRLYWIACGFVPSALMLAVTNHITANLASAPFLWVVPLALYLLTFILAFARRFRATPARISRVIPLILLGIFPFVAANVIAPPGLNWALIGAHLILLYCGALLCHTALAESRPPTQYLTEFYFWIALAGVLGGVFTATIAPVVFDSVLEYPLLVALLPLFRQSSMPGPTGGKARRLDFVLPAALAALLFVTWQIFQITAIDSDKEVLAFAHTAFVFVAYHFRNRIQRFAMAFAVLLAGYGLAMPHYLDGGEQVSSERNFFGVKKVFDNTSYRWLIHGDTLHGMESLEPDRQGEPLSYYHATGPVSEVIATLQARDRTQRFGVLGLGSGTMAAYAGPTQQVRFFELDPDVVPTARQYFTFLPRCGGNCDVVIGDGRLQLTHEPDASFDLLMLDAFSSDSVPAHLLSREALQLYLAKLKEDGILLFNASNRFLRVDKLISSLLVDAGLATFSRFDEAGIFRSEGKTNSTYVIAARRPEHLGPIPDNYTWKRATFPGEVAPWTDDYSNLFSLIRWR